ncbi:MAG TPA: AsmA-like C-terminal region-containing protein [Terriglobales bacterium]|nr:AsmA-like C-terminal region-containing protein [Terriglobales bacterium]
MITAPSAATRIPAGRRRSSLVRWSLMGLALVAVILGGMAILIIRNWPFTRQAVTVALQDRFARTVEMRSFRTTYFPPGCVVEGLSFLHRQHKNLPPLITVRTLIVQASYGGMFSIQKRVDHVQVIGLHVLVPPKSPNGQGGGVMPLTDSSSKNSLAIGEIRADGAVLEFMSSRRDTEPFKLQVHQLTLDHVGEKGPILYRATLLNTEPPGEIRSTGQFGPWNSDAPGSTPVSGSYTFGDANLGVFEGIGGILSAHGKFNGTLEHIESEGGADVPNFHVSSSAHIVPMTTEFQAVVDGTNGDTQLLNVRSHFQRTTVLSSGGIAGQPGQRGKTVALEMIVKDGRIDDLLRLIAEDKNPSMTGSVTFHAKVKVPPGSLEFLKRLDLEGDFGIGNERFTNAEVQEPLNRLSESARGENKKQQAEDPETVLSNLKGHVSVKNGIATLSNISFSAPGTRAEIRGTYNLLDKTVNLQGVLHTNGKLSDTTSGFKALVLKAVGPFLKKKTVTVVPFTVTGTSKQPSFALDFDAKRTL